MASWKPKRVWYSTTKEVCNSSWPFFLYYERLSQSSCSAVVSLPWMSSSRLKWNPFQEIFTFRNLKRQQDDKSGEFSESSNSDVYFLAKIRFTASDVWEISFLWKSNSLSKYLAFVVEFLFMTIPRLEKTLLSLLFRRNGFVMDNFFRTMKADQSALFQVWYHINTPICRLPSDRCKRYSGYIHTFHVHPFVTWKCFRRDAYRAVVFTTRPAGHMHLLYSYPASLLTNYFIIYYYRTLCLAYVEKNTLLVLFLTLY
jgi:hypothetical protein